MIQIEALGLVGIVLLVWYGGTQTWNQLALRRVRAAGRGEGRTQNYVLYFWGPDCTTCRMRQEPALRQLEGVAIKKVNALEESVMAQRYQVYTLPTTVVVGVSGEALHVNYGFASATKLRRQLGQAKS